MNRGAPGRNFVHFLDFLRVGVRLSPAPLNGPFRVVGVCRNSIYALARFSAGDSMLAFYPLTLVQTAMLFATMATWTAMVDDKSFTGLLTARNNVSMIPNPDVTPPLVSTPSSDRPGPQKGGGVRIPVLVRPS